MALFTGSTVNLTGGNPLFHPFLSALDGFNGTHFLQPGTFNNPTPAALPGVGLHDQQLEQLQEIEKKFEELRAVPITSVRSRTRPRQQRPKQQQQSHQQHQQLFVVPENSVRPEDDPSESAAQETIEKDGKTIQKSLKTDNLNVNSPATSSLGPIALKNGSVPVVPFYSYPVLTNGTLVQIPILWTAMSVAMGLEVRGEIIRGLPCIKRLNQLFCPTAGNRYPSDSIERFIDENKALIRRMYGEFQTPADLSSATSRRSLNKRQSNFHDDEIFLDDDESDSIFGGGFVSDSANRTRRQAANKNSTNRLDSCESTVEVVTPYWAANSSGKVRAIVNTQHFEQAIHQEVCQKTTTKRCTGDCGCEQKYKWHRLLAYDPDNDCKGIFMDWFLFPSCCVCRCAPLPGQ